MQMKRKITALLFMKAHSERVPEKNIRKLCGKPLFHWILIALNESNVVNKVIINTDSEEIAQNAQDNFDVTIHMRPQHLQNIQSDEAYQIMSYDIDKIECDHFIQTHSTNPLLKGDTIKRAVDLYFKNLSTYDSLFSVTPIQTRMYDNLGVPINHDPKKLVKTQNLPLIYEENSCIYLFNRNCFTQNKNRIGNNPLFFPTPKDESVDIDDEVDFLLAESIMQKNMRLGN